MRSLVVWLNHLQRNHRKHTPRPISKCHCTSTFLMKNSLGLNTVKCKKKNHTNSSNNKQEIFQQTMHRLNVDKLIRSTCIYRYFDCEIKYWYLEYLKGILHISNHPFTAYTSFKDHPDFTFANLVVFYINCASCNCKLLSKNSKVNGIDTKKRNTRVIRWYGCN